jgi:hypothetical protein
MLRLKSWVCVAGKIVVGVVGGKASVLKSFQQKPRAEGGLVGSTQAVKEKLDEQEHEKLVARSTFRDACRIEKCACITIHASGDLQVDGHVDLWRGGRAVELGRGH